MKANKILVPGNGSRAVDIIMGIPYKKRFGEFDLGRTTPYLLKHAPCHVWICRETLC